MASYSTIYSLPLQCRDNVALHLGLTSGGVLDPVFVGSFCLYEEKGAISENCLHCRKVTNDEEQLK